MEQLILDAIRRASRYAIENEAAFIQRVREEAALQQEAAVRESRRKLTKGKRRREEISRLIKKLYESYAADKIPENHFSELLAGYDAEQKSLDAELERLQAEIDRYNTDSVRADRFLELVKRHTEFTELTPTLLNEFVEKAKDADGFVFATPVYFAHPSGRIFDFLDRAFYSSNGYENFKFKPGAAVAIARRGGTTASLDALNKYFGIAQMPTAGSTYWNMVHGLTAEDAPYLAWAADSGIVAGYDDGTFRPEKTLTREQMAVMLARYYARSGVTTQGSLDFADAAKISGWAVDGVSVCVGLGLVQGDPRGRFLPQSRLTRAQIASILVRMAG